MSRAGPLALVILGLAGLSLGWGAGVVWERERLEAGPPGWTSTHPSVPVRLQELAGPPRRPGQGWPLDGHGLLRGPQAGEGVEAVVELGAAGQIELRLGEGARGAALVLSAVGDGLAAVATLDAEVREAVSVPVERRWLRCSGSLPPPGPGPVRVGVLAEGKAVRARVGDAEITCGAEVLRGAPSLRSGLRRVGLHELEVDGRAWRAPAAAWPARAAAGLLGAGLLVGLARRRPARVAAAAALCALPLLAVAPLAGSDLDRVLQAARLLPEHPLRVALALPLSASLVLVAAALQAGWVRRPTDLRARGAPAVAGAAMGAALGLAGVLAPAGGGLLPLGVGLPAGAALGGLGAAVVGALAPTASPRRAVVGAGLFGLAAGVLAIGLGPHWPWAVAFASLAGACLGLLVWANARADAVRGFNLWSLALVALGLACVEQGLTWTRTGARLVGETNASEAPIPTPPAPEGGPPRGPAPGGPPMGGTTDDRAGTWRTFEQLERVRAWTDYPRGDYPVRPPARTADLRIVAFGSSSTAGAFQNDDIEQFWPAHLQRRLGARAQVVNQGVGGWTSLHVRRLLQTQEALVDPDLAIVYLGHNDLLTPSVRPYSQLHAAWMAGASADTGTRLSVALSRVRSYQLLRLALTALQQRGSGVAVPITDARENLTAVVEILRRRGGRTLLVAEAVAPDPAVMAPYAAMMSDLAGASDVAFLDGGEVLLDPRLDGLFLDDCHLTQAGHARLAAAVEASLRAEGWLPAGPAP